MQSDGSRHAPGWSEWLERLARLIPGVGRYQDREGLREMDKQVRVHLAGLMTDLGRMVEGEQRRLTDAKRLDRLPALDRVARLINTLADRIRLAAYGFTGVFDLHRIRETELAALHRYDLGLAETASRLRGSVQGLADASTDEATFSKALHAVEAALQEFEGTMANRDQVARGL